jgi:hypothetical protein
MIYYGGLHFNLPAKCQDNCIIKNNSRHLYDSKDRLRKEALVLVLGDLFLPARDCGYDGPPFI